MSRLLEKMAEKTGLGRALLDEIMEDPNTIVQVSTHNTERLLSPWFKRNDLVYRKMRCDKVHDPENLLAEDALESEVLRWLSGQLSEETVRALIEREARDRGNTETLTGLENLLGEGRESILAEMMSFLVEEDFDMEKAVESSNWMMFCTIKGAGVFAKYNPEELRAAIDKDFRCCLTSEKVYWTEDGVVNPVTAKWCGLLAFRYCDKEYLVCDGDEDARSRIDAYAALCYGWLPSDSYFLTARQRFEETVGKDVAKEVDRRAARKRTEVKIIFDARG